MPREESTRVCYTTLTRTYDSLSTETHRGGRTLFHCVRRIRRVSGHCVYLCVPTFIYKHIYLFFVWACVRGGVKTFWTLCIITAAAAATVAADIRFFGTPERRLERAAALRRHRGRAHSFVSSETTETTILMMCLASGVRRRGRRRRIYNYNTMTDGGDETHNVPCSVHAADEINSIFLAPSVGHLFCTALSPSYYYTYRRNHYCYWSRSSARARTAGYAVRRNRPRGVSTRLHVAL